MVRSTRKLVPPAELNAFALDAYPEDNLETAVQKYVVKNWIKWANFKTNGVRYIIAEGLCITKHEGETNDRNRLFWNKLQYPVDPREIDRMNKAKEAARSVLKHKSEDQWNIPRHSDTHFLNFPREILDSIFKHALVALPGTVVSPNLLATNWKKRYIEPSHKIHVTGQEFEPHYSDDGHRPWPYNPAYFDNSHVSFKRKTLRDENGKYVELQRILRPQIDATILRTCKLFHEVGSILLYRQNSFRFGMASETMEKSSPSWIGKWAYRPEPSKHVIGKGSISKAIQQLQRKAGITSIPGWCYYDPLIRFLSQVRIHVDHWGTLPTSAGLQVEFNEIFAQFLKNEIRELKTVRVLKVVAAKPPRDHDQKADVSIARDTIQCFEERETARVEK
ncbi:hypothetical protein BHYA_0137g00030 [Botrytis hyacinthi]|uniref:Uncharacterized protein n=1 Tax=Botrytis hyacinthi TaxID=278943 RepID=A0A4Z1GGE2_9HELO|nr:hypothetical protein BHYA_0137g00030 [Botrytis hyacinthi]